jgi:hypothetical protein
MPRNRRLSHQKVPTSALQVRTWELLKNRPANLSLKMVSALASVSLPWLGRFITHGETGQFTCDRIEAVYNVVSPRKLILS